MELNSILAAHTANAAPNDPLRKLLTEIQKLDGNRRANLYKLKQKLRDVDKQFQKMTPEPALTQWFHDYNQALAAVAEQHKREFGAALEHALAAQGLALDGQYPRLYAGLFTFALNFDKGKCVIWYGPEKEKLGESPLDAAKVAAAVEKMRKQLGCGLEPAELVNKIHLAYRLARCAQPVEPIILATLLPYMALLVQAPNFLLDPRRELYRSYSRADLSYDLYRTHNTARNFKLHIATRAQTVKVKDSLWIPRNNSVEGGIHFHSIEMID